MTKKLYTATDKIKEAIEAINALPTSTNDPAFAPTLLKAINCLEAACDILSFVQCDIHAQADKL